MVFAVGEPSLLESGFLRQVAGQVAKGRLGRLVCGQPRQIQLAQTFSSCCSALFLRGRLSSAVTFTVGAISFVIFRRLWIPVVGQSLLRACYKQVYCEVLQLFSK